MGEQSSLPGGDVRTRPIAHTIDLRDGFWKFPRFDPAPKRCIADPYVLSKFTPGHEHLAKIILPGNPVVETVVFAATVRLSHGDTPLLRSAALA